MYYDEELYRDWLQREFLKAVDEIHPDVRKSLGAELLKPFTELRGAVEISTDWEILQRYVDSPPVKDFCERIRAWATRWNLTAEWCMVAAVETLQTWEWFGKDGFRHERLKMMSVYEPPEGLPYYEQAFGRNAYLERIRNDAQSAIENDPVLKYGESSHCEGFIRSILSSERITKYCDLVESELRKFVPPEHRTLSRHMEWAARVHVKGDKQIDIVREAELRGEPLDASTVSHAINSTLKTLELRS